MSNCFTLFFKIVIVVVNKPFFSGLKVSRSQNFTVVISYCKLKEKIIKSLF